MKEVLELALEALKNILNIDITEDHGVIEAEELIVKVIAAIKEALAQLEQEPVAQWQKRNIEQTDGMWCDTTETDAKWWLDQKTLHGWEVRKVYTTPPQRKPLSHEQRIDLLTVFWKIQSKSQFNAPTALINMVEAAHGIK